MDINYFDEFNKRDFDTKIECIYYDENKNQVIVNINGDVETFYTKTFTDCLFKLIDNEKKLKAIFLNFLKVNYVSSSLIASLVHIFMKLKMSGINLYFVNPKQFLQDVIDVLGMAHLIKNINLTTNNPIETLCSACKNKIILSKFGENVCPHCKAINFFSDKAFH